MIVIIITMILNMMWMRMIMIVVMNMMILNMMWMRMIKMWNLSGRPAPESSSTSWETFLSCLTACRACKSDVIYDLLFILMQLDENDLLACRYSCLLVLGLFSGLATTTSSSLPAAVSHGFLCFPSHTLPGSALPPPFSHFFPTASQLSASQFRERLPSRRPRVRLESRVARNLLAWKAIQYQNSLNLNYSQCSPLHW